MGAFENNINISWLIKSAQETALRFDKIKRNAV